MTSKLKTFVSNWLEERAVDYDNGIEGVLEDLFKGGCQSGFVGELIYYTDTTKFYNDHQKEIDAMLADLLDSCGCTTAELFGDKWEVSDHFARYETNQNLLAWFGFEEMARVIERDGELG